MKLLLGRRLRILSGRGAPRSNGTARAGQGERNDTDELRRRGLDQAVRRRAGNGRSEREAPVLTDAAHAAGNASNRGVRLGASARVSTPRSAGQTRPCRLETVQRFEPVDRRGSGRSAGHPAGASTDEAVDLRLREGRGGRNQDPEQHAPSRIDMARQLPGQALREGRGRGGRPAAARVFDRRGRMHAFRRTRSSSSTG